MSNNKNSKGLCKIHNVRFYNLTTKLINCMAYDEVTGKLALCRDHSTIEIWNMNNLPFLERTISCDSGGGDDDDGGQQNKIKLSIESLTWMEKRLFSCGLSGELIEWNLLKLQPKQRITLTGTAASCMDISKTKNLLAIGTAEGYLNLFSCSDDNSIDYVRIFDKQEGRILCCKFDVTGDFLVTGSLDILRIWNVKNGHAIHKMNIGRTEAKKETKIWTLVVLKNFTIITGDSRGRITIWDGKLGVQIDSFAVLKADILSITVCSDETVFCCAGIDPIIRMFTLTPIKKDNQTIFKWIKFIQRDVHDHTVLTLTSPCSNDNDKRIFSGGIDGYLGVSYTTKTIGTKLLYAPFLQQPCACVANSKRLILLKYFDYFEIWSLGLSNDKNTELISDNTDNNNKRFLSLEKGIRKLIQIKSKKSQAITCCSISSNGKWIVYSTDSYIRLFKTNFENTKSDLMLVKNLPKELVPCHKILFSSDSKSLFTAKLNGEIVMFDTEDDINFKTTLNTSKVLKDTLHLWSISSCGQFMVTVGLCCTVSIWKYNNDHWKHYHDLPMYDTPASAIAIHQNSLKLVIAFVDLKVYEYDFDNMHFTCTDNVKSLTKSTNYIINNIVLDPKNENIIILQNDNYLYVLEKNINTNIQSPKIAKRESLQGRNIARLKLKSMQKYEHLVHLSWMGENEMVAVDVNAETLVAQLPPALRQKKFGVT